MKVTGLFNVALNVIECARCGQDHSSLSFTVFKEPVAPFTHFALCPYNQQPILLRVLGESD